MHRFILYILLEKCGYIIYSGLYFIFYNENIGNLYIFMEILGVYSGTYCILLKITLITLILSDLNS